MKINAETQTMVCSYSYEFGFIKGKKGRVPFMDPSSSPPKSPPMDNRVHLRASPRRRHRKHHNPFHGQGPDAHQRDKLTALSDSDQTLIEQATEALIEPDPSKGKSLPRPARSFITHT